MHLLTSSAGEEESSSNRESQLYSVCAEQRRFHRGDQKKSFIEEGAMKTKTDQRTKHNITIQGETIILKWGDCASLSISLRL